MDWKLFWNSLAAYVVERGKERSTYIGIIAIGAALGFAISPEIASGIASVASAIAGAILIGTNDKK